MRLRLDVRARLPSAVWLVAGHLATKSLGDRNSLQLANRPLKARKAANLLANLTLKATGQLSAVWYCRQLLIKVGRPYLL